MQPILLPLLVAIISAIIYIVCVDETLRAKTATLAKAPYFAAILVTILVFANASVKLFQL